MTHASQLLRNLLIFGRRLQRAGVAVHPGRLLDVIEALEYINLGHRDEVYHTCRTLLIHRREQLATFDRVFAAFWQEHQEDESQRRHPLERSVASTSGVESFRAVGSDATSPDDEDDDPSSSADGGIKVWSDIGALAEKDFAAFTEDEMAEARSALARLVWRPGVRRTRRWLRGRGRQIDVRRAIASGLRTGGDVVTLPRRRRRLRPRTLVLLCDVSGSMERYTRMLLHFAHAVVDRHERVEAFLFATELTRITTQLQRSRPDDAVSAVTRSVRDWSGGTRIGAAIRQFHHQWGSRVSGGAVVLLISDGWDRGDPEELRSQIARLQRRCHRLVWLNPLIGTTDYAPLTRGLQSALPYVDDFLPSRTLNNLADLALHLNTLA